MIWLWTISGALLCGLCIFLNGRINTHAYKNPDLDHVQILRTKYSHQRLCAVSMIGFMVFALATVTLFYFLIS